MKKKNLQRTMALALTGIMAMGALAGCGGKSDDAPATNNNTSTTDTSSTSTTTDNNNVATDASSNTSSTENATSAVAGIDGWEAFAENVTLQIPVYDRGDAGNGCSDVKNNYWTKWVQENFGDKYNITVEYIPITRNAVMNDYAMLAAANDLPTILMEYDYDKLATWEAEGYLQPYDMEEFKTIAPTFYQTMVDEGIDIYTQLEGDDYLLLGKRPYGNTNYTFLTWYRLDWLKEAGFDKFPANNTELLELYAKLVENGHEAPLSGNKVQGAGVDQNYGYRDYPQDEVTWATTGDYQIPALSTEAQKRFLKWENKIYNDGYKNKEYYLRDATETEADFINGKAFQWSGYVSSTMNVLNSFYETNPDAELAIMICDSNWAQDPTWGSSPSYRPTNVFGAMTAFANDATQDEMKAAMMYMEWMSQEDVLFTMTWGEEGINYTVGDDGNPVAVADQKGLEQQQGHNNNVDYWMIVTAAKSLGNIEKDVAAITPQGIPQDFYQQILDNYKGQLALYESGYANSDALFASVPAAVSEYGQTLYDLYPEYRDQLTMCAPEEFDALYDELSQKYLDAGYQEVIDARKEVYDEGLTTKLPK